MDKNKAPVETGAIHEKKVLKLWSKIDDPRLRRYEGNKKKPLPIG
jgi:hypothetical protein